MKQISPAATSTASLAACSLALFSLGLASGQAAIDAGALTGATSTAAGAAGKGTASAIGGIFSGLNKSLERASGTSSAVVAAPHPSAPANRTVIPAAAAGMAAEGQTIVVIPNSIQPDVLKPVQLAKVTPGMTREELLAQMGHPAQKMSMAEGSHFVERYVYGDARVILEDGKVRETLGFKSEAPGLFRKVR